MDCENTIMKSCEKCTEQGFVTSCKERYTKCWKDLNIHSSRVSGPQRECLCHVSSVRGCLESDTSCQQHLHRWADTEGVARDDEIL